MDRFAVGAGLLLVSGVSLIFAGAFNVLSSGIQIAGFGTVVLGASVSLYKLYSDRKEAARKRREERTQMMKSTVYAPLLKWAVNGAKGLQEHSIDHDVFWDRRVLTASIISDPPILADVPDYSALAGETLKSRVNQLEQLFGEYMKLWEKVRLEYREVLNLYAQRINPQWGVDNLDIQFFGADDKMQFEYPIMMVAFGSGVQYARERAAAAHHASLHQRDRPEGTVPCPPEMLRVFTFEEPEELPSFTKFLMARDRLRADLEVFTSELGKIIAHGETDWKL